jgi:hypothetical protein
VQKADRELLARIDERTNNIWRVVEKVEQHQVEQNGLMRKTCEKTERNTIWRRVIVGVGGSVFLIIIGWLFYLSGIRL